MSYLNKLEKFLCVLSILSIVFLVVMQVFMRYVTGQSLAWSEELTSWCFLWMAWLGISANYIKNEHISIGGLTLLISSKKAKQVSSLLICVCSVLFLGYLALITYQTTMKPYIWRQSSVVLGLPVYILYISVVTGCILSIVNLIYFNVISFKNNK
ncbi:TRAP transporter small permease [Marinomonas flavescens]|uniref:TRAP transporter small permease n=1 Tax=Marinomonas flavescens TaxID=2529379 RepID=UPI001055E26C|nr:TRAP transporter small permease [Marinomonas flavescens]